MFDVKNNLPIDLIHISWLHGPINMWRLQIRSSVLDKWHYHDFPSFLQVLEFIMEYSQDDNTEVGGIPPKKWY